MNNLHCGSCNKVRKEKKSSYEMCVKHYSEYESSYKEWSKQTDYDPDFANDLASDQFKLDEEAMIQEYKND